MRRNRALRLPLPATDLGALRERVRALTENRPGVYRMTDPTGRVLYVGKAKRLRARLLSYFRATYPDDKAARILHAAHDIQWEYVPSEFAAYLSELRQIHRHRPHFNLRLNQTRRAVFVKLSGGPAPRITSGAAIGADDARCYGPFRSLGRTAEAVRTLADLLGLRDCAADMPIVFSGQGDLFDQSRRAACMRHEFGFCTGPCAGFVAEWDYRQRVETAVAFLEGRTIRPIDRVVSAMEAAAARSEFELAAKWREKFEQLEWLFGPSSGPGPRSICSPSSTAIRRVSETTGCTSSAAASCGRRFPTPPPPSSTRRFAESSRRSSSGRAGDRTAADGLHRRAVTDHGLVPGAPRVVQANDSAGPMGSVSRPHSPAGSKGTSRPLGGMPGSSSRMPTEGGRLKRRCPAPPGFITVTTTSTRVSSGRWVCPKTRISASGNAC